MRLEGLGQLKNPMTSSVIEPATFRYPIWVLKNIKLFLFLIARYEMSGYEEVEL
jgi:hypothetical protein